MENAATLYEDIAARTGGDIYLGVVGPVRTGKSTFIKRFMETLVIPNIGDMYRRERARDELPQSGSGRTITTSEPKFVPEEAVDISLESGVSLSVRLIDCVGYMVDSAAGRLEDGEERMVTTPWFDTQVTITQAAEQGTRRVVMDHSTLALVVTTDGSICGIPREEYAEPEARVIAELKSIGKPFVVLLNSARPESPEAQALARSLSETYGVACLCVSCLELDGEDITRILRSVLYEFPLRDLGVYLPPWAEALPPTHPLYAALCQGVLEAAQGLERLRDVDAMAEALRELAPVEAVQLTRLDAATGRAGLTVTLPEALYYEELSRQAGTDIRDSGQLMALLGELAGLRAEYARVAQALADVRETGYGVVLPSREEMQLDAPEIVRQGGRYGVKLRASAPAIHLLRTQTVTEVSPALGGGDRAGEEILSFLLQGFEGDTARLWESNIFGKSLEAIAEEGLVSRIRSLPEDARRKLGETLERILNEGSGGLLCILL